MRPNPLTAMRVIEGGSFRSALPSPADGCRDSGRDASVQKDPATRRRSAARPTRAPVARRTAACGAADGGLGAEDGCLRRGGRRPGARPTLACGAADGGLGAADGGPWRAPPWRPHPAVKVRRYSLGVVPRMRWKCSRRFAPVPRPTSAAICSTLRCSARAVRGPGRCGRASPTASACSRCPRRSAARTCAARPRRAAPGHVEGEGLAEPVQRPLAGGGEHARRAARARCAARTAPGRRCGRGPRPGGGPRGWTRPRRGRRAGCAGTGRCPRRRRPT